MTKRQEVREGINKILTKYEGLPPSILTKEIWTYLDEAGVVIVSHVKENTEYDAGRMVTIEPLIEKGSMQLGG